MENFLTYLQTKIFYIEIGNFKSSAPLCILPINQGIIFGLDILNQGIIFGLDILKTLSISLIFAPEKIHVFQKEVFLNTKFVNEKHRALNSMKITLYPNQKKLVSFYSLIIVEGEDYVGHAYHSSPSIVLPCISTMFHFLVKNLFVPNKHARLGALGWHTPKRHLYHR